MIYSCLHTHSTFCDGKDDIETMCRSAYEKHFESIGFSSHAPIAKKTGIVTGWHLADERLNEYIDAVLDARERWRGRLSVYLGLEMDYIAGRCGPADADLRELPLDYLIGAVHYVASPRGDLMTVDGFDDDFEREFRAFFDNDGKALYRAYYTAYQEMICGGGFDILAHFDLVKKNNRRFGFFLPGDADYQECVAKTVKTAARQTRNFVVEVNTGGMIRGRTGDPYPSSAILRLLKAQNIPLTISADAHAADHLGGCYEDALRIMAGAGYTETMLIDGSKEGKPHWRPQRINPARGAGSAEGMFS
ncbi:MAG: histidinol-phosphatase [Treponema sp.]|jgi:histidinol-phosphatase (PHP family)|nr:histidinol-phosphatase [Treponema sp.]